MKAAKKKIVMAWTIRYDKETGTTTPQTSEGASLKSYTKKSGETYTYSGSGFTSANIQEASLNTPLQMPAPESSAASLSNARETIKAEQPGALWASKPAGYPVYDKKFDSSVLIAPATAKTATSEKNLNILSQNLAGNAQNLRASIASIRREQEPIKKSGLYGGESIRADDRKSGLLRITDFKSMIKQTPYPQIFYGVKSGLKPDYEAPELNIMGRLVRSATISVINPSRTGEIQRTGAAPERIGSLAGSVGSIYLASRGEGLSKAGAVAAVKTGAAVKNLPSIPRFAYDFVSTTIKTTGLGLATREAYYSIKSDETGRNIIKDYRGEITSAGREAERESISGGSGIFYNPFKKIKGEFEKITPSINPALMETSPAKAIKSKGAEIKTSLTPFATGFKSFVYELPGGALLVKDKIAFEAGAKNVIKQKGLIGEAETSGLKSSWDYRMGQDVGETAAVLYLNKLTEQIGRAAVTQALNKKVITSGKQAFWVIGRTIGLRAGSIEGGADSIMQNILRDEKIDIKRSGAYAGIGTITAGLLGGGIGATGIKSEVAETAIKRGGYKVTSKGLQWFGYLSDLAEKPGDLLQDAHETIGRKILGKTYPTPRATYKSVKVITPSINIPVSEGKKSDVQKPGTLSDNNIISELRKERSEGFTKPTGRSITSDVLSPTKTPVATPPSFTPSYTPVIDNAFIPSDTPVKPPRSDTPVITPTETPADIPTITETPVNIPANIFTLTNTPVSVNIPFSRIPAPMPLMLPDKLGSGFGFGKGGRRKAYINELTAGSALLKDLMKGGQLAPSYVKKSLKSQRKRQKSQRKGKDKEKRGFNLYETLF